MSPADGNSDEMRPVPFDDALADSIFSGDGDERMSAALGCSQIVDLVRDARRPASADELPASEVMISHIVERLERSLMARETSEARRPPLASVGWLRLVLVVGVLLTVGGTAAAALTGSLPTRLQDNLAHRLSGFGFDVPLHHARRVSPSGMVKMPASAKRHTRGVLPRISNPSPAKPQAGRTALFPREHASYARDDSSRRVRGNERTSPKVRTGSAAEAHPRVAISRRSGSRARTRPRVAPSHLRRISTRGFLPVSRPSSVARGAVPSTRRGVCRARVAGGSSRWSMPRVQKSVARCNDALSGSGERAAVRRVKRSASRL